MDSYAQWSPADSEDTLRLAELRGVRDDRNLPTEKAPEATLLDERQGAVSCCADDVS